MAEADDDKDGMISLRDFLMLFRKRNKGELLHSSPSLAAVISYFNDTEVNVNEVGVTGAKSFFLAKSAKTNITGLSIQEVKAEAEISKVKRAEKAVKKEEFEARRNIFSSGRTTSVKQI